MRAVFYLLGLLLGVIAPATLIDAANCNTPGFCTPTPWGDCRSPGPGDIHKITWTEVRTDGPDTLDGNGVSLQNSWCCDVITGDVVDCEDPLQSGVVKCWKIYVQSDFNGWESATCPDMEIECTEQKCKLNCVTTTIWTRVAGEANECPGNDDTGYTCPDYMNPAEYDQTTKARCLIEFAPCKCD
jgi:hypothetical protein